MILVVSVQRRAWAVNGDKEVSQLWQNENVGVARDAARQ
jgi:hypothetical protein